LDLSNWQTQLRKGILEIVVLNLLADGRLHGYEMVQRLRQVNGLNIREGNIYPILARLETDGLVISDTEPSRDGPPRRTFSLTNKGRQCLSSMNEHWDQMVESIQQIKGKIQ
jgi:PadR family transcriptional regulator, regulatory protein PadR